MRGLTDILGTVGENGGRQTRARLVEGLKKQRSLMNLERMVSMKKEDLAGLNEAYTQLRRDSQVIQTATVSARAKTTTVTD